MNNSPRLTNMKVGGGHREMTLHSVHVRR